MAVLEGIGDEVVVCVVCLLLLLLTYLAWFLISLPIHQGRLPPVNTRPNANSLRVQELQSHIEEVHLDRTESFAEHQPTEGSEVDLGAAEGSGDGVQEDETPTSTSESDNVPENLDETRKRRLDFFDGRSNREEVSVCNGSVPSASEVIEETDSSSPSQADAFQLRLKYLDDTERTVVAQPTDTIGHFKRCHFSAEFSENKTVRLIYRGQVLRDEGTLSSYGLSSGCCVHVQVVGRQQGQRPGAPSNETELDLSQFLWPLLGVFLGVLWMCHFHYREYFATSSTVALFGLSGLFLTVVWGQYTSSRPERAGR